jgi:hypothetical protein
LSEIVEEKRIRQEFPIPWISEAYNKDYYKNFLFLDNLRPTIKSNAPSSNIVPHMGRSIECFRFKTTCQDVAFTSQRYKESPNDSSRRNNTMNMRNAKR